MAGIWFLEPVFRVTRSLYFLSQLVQSFAIVNQSAWSPYRSQELVQVYNRNPSTSIEEYLTRS